MTYRSSNRKWSLRVTEKLRKLESVEETTENKVNENDYLLKLNRRVVKLSRTVFFQRGKISAVSTHGSKHQTYSQGFFLLAPTEREGLVTYAADLCVLNVSVHKTTCG